MPTCSHAPRSAGRPRAFDIDEVVHAARNVFSAHGPELTSIADLERQTGIDRSSVYNAFGSKQALFEAALRSYLEEGIGSTLSALRQPDAGLKTVATFFVGIAQTLRADPVQAARGCLMVNAVARGEISEKRVRPRARLLASLTMGLFVTARIDPIDAAEVCRDVAGEVRSGALRAPAADENPASE